jgi:hypothetical protein
MQKKRRLGNENSDWMFNETSHIEQDLIKQVVSDRFDCSEYDTDMENDEITKMILFNSETALKSVKAMTTASKIKFQAYPHDLRHDQKQKEEIPCQEKREPVSSSDGVKICNEEQRIDSLIYRHRSNQRCCSL